MTGKSNLPAGRDTVSIPTVSNMNRQSGETSNDSNAARDQMSRPALSPQGAVSRSARGEQPNWESESERVFELLQEDLIAGFFSPREPLSESGLSKRFGASRTPVREAIVRLVGDRLLESRPHASAVVREITPRDISQIYEMRQAVEVYSLETAGAYIEDKQLERLMAVYDATSTDRAIGLVPESISHKGVTPLHMMIIESLGNGRLTDVLCAQSMPIARTHALYWRMAHPRVDALQDERRRVALQEHREIVTALRDHDVASARAALIGHLRHSADHLLRIMTTFDLEEPRSPSSAQRISRRLPNLLDHMIPGVDPSSEDMPS
jgi:DNA-binding GntR family transcriptional regulator